MMEAALACGIALSLAQQITDAAAFTNEPVAPPPATSQVTPPAQLGQPPVLPLPGQSPQIAPNDPLALTKPSGTDLTIPGLGTIGTIPKLDFGLELLYGPKTGPDALQLDQHAPENDMQIKGTFTHKF
jgi:hypothetical protein